MSHTLNINGKLYAVQEGETLVDAALSQGVLIPHDCATGQCETCRVRVAHGAVDAANTSYGDTVLACQARILGDATITYEEAPEPETTACRIEEIFALSDSVLEVVVRTDQPLRYKPGQYGKLTFAGFPAREYSYCEKMDGTSALDRAIFQIKRLHKGKVSSALGNSITKGHKGKLTGPFGSAFLRSQETGPLVLTASGTGFAPIWSLARAVTLATPKRAISIIAGGRSIDDLYMEQGLNWLRDHSHDNITVTAQDMSPRTNIHLSGLAVKRGVPDAFLPELDTETTVHVAGNPALVDRVKERALAAQAKCYADPFTASTNTLGLAHRLKGIIGLNA